MFPGKSQYLNNDLYKNDKNIITLLDSVNPFTWRKVSKYIIDNTNLLTNRSKPILDTDQLIIETRAGNIIANNSGNSDIKVNKTL